MPRKKAQTLYDHCFKELLDERMQDLKDGKDVTRIGDVAVTQRVVEYAKKAPYVKLPRTRKKKEKEDLSIHRVPEMVSLNETDQGNPLNG